MGRLYQTDSYLRRVTTRVLECRPAGEGFEVRLADALLYPGGGGQPADRGTVDGLEVIDVRADDEDGQVVVLPRDVVGEVEVVLDWPRRYDLMQQHTAQHVITTVAGDELGLTTTAFHIGGTVCDIEFDARTVEPEVLVALEERVNQHVRAMRPVSVEWAAPEEVERGRVRSRLLPEDVAGPLRIVIIEGLDRNTCGGTHVANTAELQLVKLVGTERLTRSFRVFYAAGDRVRRLFEAQRAREDALGALLSCGAADLVDHVEKLQEQVRSSAKEGEHLLDKLAEAVAATLGGDDDWAVHHLDVGDAAYVRKVALEACRGRPGRRALVTAGQGSGPFALAGPPDWVDRAGPIIAKLLQGRGGGRNGLFQGKAGSLRNIGKAKEILRSSNEH